MSRYWKCNKATAAKVKAFVAEWDDILAKACNLSKSLGGDSKKVLTAQDFGRTFVCGFRFSDPSKVDKKHWVQIKQQPDCWRPRARRGRSVVEAWDSFRSWHLSNIADLIGMEVVNNGLSWQVPGYAIRKDTVYLITPDEVEAKGCTRISDIEFEKATAPKKRKTAKSK